MITWEDANLCDSSAQMSNLYKGSGLSTGHIQAKEKITLASTFDITADFLKVTGSLHSKP